MTDSQHIHRAVRVTFTCPKCGRTTTHPRDAENGWCWVCQDWTEDHGNPAGWIREHLSDPRGKVNP